MPTRRANVRWDAACLWHNSCFMGASFTFETATSRALSAQPPRIRIHSFVRTTPTPPP
jgi:hypothetical protein